MIPFLHNWEVLYSIGFYVLAKLISFLAEYLRFSPMSISKKAILTRIPENEGEDENVTMCKKWVPKKKHEVLKAKYKCLKKLFQIYDASLIGMFPAGYEDSTPQYSEVSNDRKHRRRKRSRRSHTDAEVGTSEESTQGDTDDLQSSQNLTASTEVGLISSDHNLTDVQSAQSQTTTKSTQSLNGSLSQVPILNSRLCQNFQGLGDRECLNPRQHQRFSPSMPVDMYSKERPTKFQLFVYRIFGIRCERPLKTVVFNTNAYAISDKNLTHNHTEKRRRRGIRFGRNRRLNVKFHKEPSVIDLNSPVILEYVQSVQRSCLTDTTPRQCPIVGCGMLCYGIINYNDHLNLCHFPERNYICHYCHVGFANETDKIMHENEHLGLNKLNIKVTTSNNKILRQATCDIQTENRTSNEISEDKLKRIVSLLDKFVESDQLIHEMKKNNYSESNIHEKQSNTQTSSLSTDIIRKRTMSLTKTEKASSEVIVNAKCHVCGENFDNGRQLNLHSKYEHSGQTKCAKFHSCAGIVNVPKNYIGLIADDGQIKIESIAKSCNMIPSTVTILSKTDKLESSNLSPHDLTYSTSNYSTSTVHKKSSAISSMLSSMKKTSMYKWEPGTKIIHV